MTFARVGVHERQRPKGLSCRRRVLHEVHRPLLIGLLDHRRDDRPAARHTFPSSPRHLEPLGAIQPVHPFVVERSTLAAQQDRQAAITKARPLGRQRTQPLPHRVVLWPPDSVARSRTRQVDQATGPPLREAVLLLEIGDSFAPGSGPYPFFATTSLSAA